MLFTSPAYQLQMAHSIYSRDPGNRKVTLEKYEKLYEYVESKQTKASLNRQRIPSNNQKHA